MRTCVAVLKSASPYSQSAPIRAEKNDGENDRDFEKRAWIDRAHIAADGTVFIPPLAFKNALSEAAYFAPQQIPGMGKTRYTKHIEAGVLVPEAVPLQIRNGHGLQMATRDDVKPEWLYVPSDGKRGGSKRVWKCFPLFPEWEAIVTFYLLDDTVTNDIFEYYLDKAGMFIGIGRSRPRNNGFYGRFSVVSKQWSEERERKPLAQRKGA